MRLCKTDAGQECMCLRSKDRSGGQRALRQQKAGERKAPQRSLLDTKNRPQLRPARELRGVIEHCGHQLGQERLLHKLSIFCGAPPPYESIACAERRFHTCRPRSGRKFSTDGQEAHSKLKKEVKKGSGSVRMARSIIPAMPRCSPGGRASSPQGASPQCASSHDCGTHLSGTVWLGRNMLLSWSPQCAQPSSLYTITCHGPRQGC